MRDGVGRTRRPWETRTPGANARDTRANLSPDLLEIILRDCAEAAPQPWYPAAYVQATGVPRDALDSSLDQLRLGGLVRLTDWVKDQGRESCADARGARGLAETRVC